MNLILKDCSNMLLCSGSKEGGEEFKLFNLLEEYHKGKDQMNKDSMPRSASQVSESTSESSA